jgi:hypothetical protein
LDPFILSKYILELQDAGISSPTLNDLSHLKMKTRNYNYLWFFLSFLFSCICIVSIIICLYPLALDRLIMLIPKKYNVFKRNQTIIEPLEIGNEEINYPPLLARNQPANASSTIPVPNAPLYNLNWLSRNSKITWPLERNISPPKESDISVIESYNVNWQFKNNTQMCLPIYDQPKPIAIRRKLPIQNTFKNVPHRKHLPKRNWYFRILLQAKARRARLKHCKPTSLTTIAEVNEPSS